MSVLSYSPTEVNVLVLGFPIEGFSTEQIITVTKDEVPFQYQKAMGGEISRLLRKDSTFTVNIPLAQTSLSNNIFTALHNADVLLGGIGKFNLIVKDNLGTSLFFSANSWIETLPPLVMTNQIETRTWQIKCSLASVTIGGNDKSLINDLLGIGGVVGGVLSGAGVL